MGSSTPGALKEKAEQGTEVPQPHRSCRAEVQHGLWCHSVSALRDKCQEIITGTIPFQGCPSALCSTPKCAPEQDPLSNSFQLQQQGNLPKLLPHCNGSSTGLPQLPGTPALSGHRSTQLQHNTSTGRTTAPPQLLHGSILRDGSTKNLQRMLKDEACPLQRRAPNQELARLPALQMPQGSRREMPKEFSPVSAAQMKGGNGWIRWGSPASKAGAQADSPAPGWLPSCP